MHFEWALTDVSLALSCLTQPERLGLCRDCINLRKGLKSMLFDHTTLIVAAVARLCHSVEGFQQPRLSSLLGRAPFPWCSQSLGSPICAAGSATLVLTLQVYFKLSGISSS
jgi:hypothetical protein